MVKSIVQDIMPPDDNRRSIRNISMGTKKRTRRVADGVRVERSTEQPRRERKIDTEHEYEEERTRPSRRRPRNGRPKFLMWGIVIVIVVFILLGFSMLFSGAKVTVTVRESRAVIDNTYTAILHGEAPELSYQVMSLSKEGELTVPATGTEKVNRRASGKIMIFNDYNSREQRLITNTRFETSDGHIYRIDRPVVVPGQKEVEGDTVPGSIEVDVYADEPGASYNSGLTDFTIPGFEGDPRYEHFYARSVTPMEGGFSGEVNVARDEDVEAARLELRDTLREEATTELMAQVPENFVLFNSALFPEYTSKDTLDNGKDSVLVPEQITLNAILFDEKELSSFIANETIADYDGTEVIVINFDDISLSVPEDFSFSVNDTEFTFTIAGSPHIVWRYDEASLIRDLAGTPKNDVDTIMRTYHGIEKAEIVIRPFWKKFFPERESRIKIKENFASE